MTAPRNLTDAAPGNGIVFPDQKDDNVSIQLRFSDEPNREVPRLVREILRSSYIKRLSSESRCEQ